MVDDKVSRREVAALVKWAGMELSEAQFEQFCKHAQGFHSMAWKLLSCWMLAAALHTK